MRSIPVLGLLIALSTAADAAAIHHHRTRHYLIIPRSVASSFAAVPSWASAPPPVHYGDAPSYNDPSKNGCCG
jgi:hypothetical protein